MRLHESLLQKTIKCYYFNLIFLRNRYNNKNFKENF